MHNDDLIALFARVRVGTPIDICCGPLDATGAVR